MITQQHCSPCNPVRLLTPLLSFVMHRALLLVSLRLLFHS
jgi:hypothetical protein